MPNYITLFIGILFANVLLLFGIMLGPMLTHYQNEITDKLIAKHQYVLKALVDVDDNAAEKYCVKTLATIEGRLKSEDVLVYGVKDNSIYADINTASLKDNEVYITNGYADKFRIKKGDKITLKEKYDDNEYEFTVKDMYDYELKSTCGATSRWWLAGKRCRQLSCDSTHQHAKGGYQHRT